MARKTKAAAADLAVEDMAPEDTRNYGRKKKATDAREPAQQEPVGQAAEPITEQPASLPLSELTPAASDINSRRTIPENSLGELMASILALGVLQPLAVRWRSGATEVVDGNRRLAALQALAKKRKIPRSFLVPVHWPAMAENHVAAEASLAANVVRLPLHPVDQFEAFTRLIETQGMTPDALADHFALAPMQVSQVLALGTLPAKVRDAWREDAITASQAQAFTVAADEKAALKVLKAIMAKGAMPYQREPREIRRALTENATEASNSAALSIVGMEAYVAAGGTARTDLFEDVTYLEDKDLLERLCTEHLKVEADAIAEAEGFAFGVGQVHRIYRTGPGDESYVEMPYEPWLSADEAKRLKSGKIDWKEQNEIMHAAQARRDADPEARAKSGVLVTVSRREPGCVEVERCVIRGDERDAGAIGEARQANAGPAPAAEGDGEEGEGEEAAETKRAPWALRLALSQQLTAAAAIAVANDARLGLVLAVAALRSGYGKPVRLDPNGWQGVRPELGPRSFADELAVANAMGLGELAAALSTAVGWSFDFTLASQDHQAIAIKPEGIQAVLSVLNGDALRDAIWETWDARAYFQRIPAAMVKAALVEMGDAPPKAMKKGPLAELAVGRSRQTGWLPLELRSSHYDGPGSEAVALPEMPEEEAEANG